MAKGFKKGGKFRPTGNKGKSSKQKSIEPFSIKLFGEKKKGSVADVTKRVKSDFKERERLSDENSMLVSEVEENPASEFNNSRRTKIKKNVGEIKRLQKDIRKNIKSLNKEQQQKLPIAIVSEVRTF